MPDEVLAYYARAYDTREAAERAHRRSGHHAHALGFTGVSVFMMMLQAPEKPDVDGKHVVAVIGAPKEAHMIAARLGGTPFALPESEVLAMAERRRLAKAGPLGDADRVKFDPADAPGEQQMTQHWYDQPRELGADGRMRPA